MVEGDRGAGDLEKRGRGVLEAGGGKREKKWGKYATLRNISQSKKKSKEWEPTNIGRKPGLKGTEAGGLNLPVQPLPPPTKCPALSVANIR